MPMYATQSFLHLQKNYAAPVAPILNNVLRKEWFEIRTAEPSDAQREAFLAMTFELQNFVGKQTCVVEFGANPEIDMSFFLKAIDAESYVCVDALDENLVSTATSIQLEHPEIKVRTVRSDFRKISLLPRSHSALSHLVFFPAYGAWNFEPLYSRVFLTHTRHLLHRGDSLVVGVDLKREREYAKNYGLLSFSELALQSDFLVEKTWGDLGEDFSFYLLRVA